MTERAALLLIVLVGLVGCAPTTGEIVAVLGVEVDLLLIQSSSCDDMNIMAFSHE